MSAAEVEQPGGAASQAAAGNPRRTRTRGTISAQQQQQENIEPNDAPASTAANPTPLKPKKSKSKKLVSEMSATADIPTPVPAASATEGLEAMDGGPSAKFAVAPTTSVHPTNVMVLAVDRSPSNAGLMSGEKGPSDLGGKTKEFKLKVNHCVSRAIRDGDPMEILARSTDEDVECCFPSLTPGDGLRSGSPIIPGQETLQELLEQAPATTEGQPNSNEQRPNEEKLQTTVLTGAFIGSSEVIESCLKQGVDLTLPDHSGRNVLHFLATTGNASLLKKVLRRLEKCNKHSPASQHSFEEVINFADARGWTPLIVAICRDNEEAAKALLAHPQLRTDILLAHTCPPSQGPQSTESAAIHFAAIRCRASLVETLTERGTPLSSLDSMNRNVFHYAAAHADDAAATSFVSALADHPKFDASLLSSKDMHDRTPVFVAIAWGNLQCAETMLRILKYRGAAQARKPTADKGVLVTLAVTPAVDKSDAENDEEVLEGNIENEESRDCSVEQESSVERPLPSEPFSLTTLLFGPDVWALTAVQAAHLRRHTHVLFGLASSWAFLRAETDPPTFVDAIRACNEEAQVFEPLPCDYSGAVSQNDSMGEEGVPTTAEVDLADENQRRKRQELACGSPTRMLQAALQDKLLFSRWLKQDFNPLERAAFEAIKAALSDGSGPDYQLQQEPQLVRAIRRVGVQMCLRCFAKTIEVVRSGAAAGLAARGGPGSAVQSGTARKSPEVVFFAVLKNTIRNDFAEAEAAAALSYINIEQNFGRRSAAGRPAAVSGRYGPSPQAAATTSVGHRHQVPHASVAASSGFRGGRYPINPVSRPAGIGGGPGAQPPYLHQASMRSGPGSRGPRAASASAGSNPFGGMSRRIPPTPPSGGSAHGGGPSSPRAVPETALSRGGNTTGGTHGSPGVPTKRMGGPPTRSSSLLAAHPTSQPSTVPSFAMATRSVMAKFGSNPRMAQSTVLGVAGGAANRGGGAAARLGGTRQGVQHTQAGSPPQQNQGNKQVVPVSYDQGSSESLDALA